MIALDIETTGLDPERDAIIEIAAVRFNASRVEDEWSSLVNPGRHIPEFIARLTGIEDAMVRQAPALREILPGLESFIGEDPIVGHNVRFDLAFLARAGAAAGREVLDTYQLAAVLMPAASRYNLGALAKDLGVLLPATHRALDDARVTHAVYTRLVELAEGLPWSTVQEIVRLAERVAWDASPLFRTILQTQAGHPEDTPKRQGERETVADSSPALDRSDATQALDADEVAAVLEHGGAFSKRLETYEQRPEQVTMARAVAQALSHGTHLLVEAGTGIGKSFAYLIPAALFATRNKTRVLVSTNTINLQDQLIRKDIPDLRDILGIDLRASVLKGRANYLCPRRFNGALRYGPRNETELRVLAKILVWQLSDPSGDRSGINLNGNAERAAWLGLSAADEGCTTETCLRRMGGACPFHLAKMAADSAHLLVVNHALLLSDVAAEGRVLPDYSYLIVDEGHHLEAATTGALAFRTTEDDLDRMVKDAGGSRAGLLGRLLSTGRKAAGQRDTRSIQEGVARATDLAFRFSQLCHSFFDGARRFVDGLREPNEPSQYAWQARIIPATRAAPGWDDVELAWHTASDALKAFLDSLSELHSIGSELTGDGSEDVEDSLADLATLHHRLSEVEQRLTALVTKPDPDQVYWVEVRASGNGLSLNSAPLRVGPLIEKVLWHEKASVILTSATLTTYGEFHYLRDTLSADEAAELQIGSPFDYENSTLLYVAEDIAEPNTSDYQRAVHAALISAARASGGRLLALFTSYAALRRAAQAISPSLEKDDIVVYEHGDGASPNVLLESFKSTERAVLLGTRSFWEGVDVPGAALSVLFIPRLPFDVPTAPLVAARAESYEDPFGEYFMPEAILRFRQGFGRLIRSGSDRGVVALLDRRVLSKKYGRFFLESLPRCTFRQGPLGSLAREVGGWLQA